MRSRLSLNLAFACSALAAALGGAPALGQEGDKAEAEAHFQAGLALVEAEKFEAAALEFDASVKLYPTKVGLFNLANVYKALSRYDETLAVIERLEREYGDKMDAEMRAAAAKMRTDITTLAARLEVEVEPAGAAVEVDGRSVGTSPLARPVLVDPGEHVVRATLAGYAAAEGRAQVISRQTRKVRLALEAAAGEATAPAPGAEGEGQVAGEDTGVEARPKKPLGQVWFWSGVGATAAFGVVTLALELAVRGKKDELATTAELDEAEGMQRAGVAFLALTGAAALTTAVLAALTEFGGEEDETVAMGVAPNGAVLAGRF